MSEIIRARHVRIGVVGFNASYYWHDGEELSGCVYFVFLKWILFINLWKRVGIYPNDR